MQIFFRLHEKHSIRLAASLSLHVPVGWLGSPPVLADALRTPCSRLMPHDLADA